MNNSLNRLSAVYRNLTLVPNAWLVSIGTSQCLNRLSAVYRNLTMGR